MDIDPDDFPVTTEFRHKTYGRTGKVGTIIASGRPAAEYSWTGPNPFGDEVEMRVWLDDANQHHPD